MWNYLKTNLIPSFVGNKEAKWENNVYFFVLQKLPVIKLGGEWANTVKRSSRETYYSSLKIALVYAKYLESYILIILFFNFGIYMYKQSYIGSCIWLPMYTYIWGYIKICYDILHLIFAFIGLAQYLPIFFWSLILL